MGLLRLHNVLYPVLFVMVGLLLQPGPLPADETDVKVISSKDHGWLGVSIQEISDDLQEAKDLDVEQGVLVNEVYDDSPAERAGLKEGDVITKFRGTDIEGISQFIDLVHGSKPGEKVSLTLVRDGKEMDVEAEIGEPEFGKHAFKFFGEGNPPAHPLMEDWPHAFSYSTSFFGGGYIGVHIHDLNDQLADALALKEDEGVFVLQADEDGPAYKAGIRGGDVIVKVDDEAIEDSEDLRSVIGEKEEGDEVEVTLYRDKKKKSFKVPVAENPELSSIRKHIEVLDLDKELEGLEDLRIDIQSNIEDEMSQLKEELEELKEELREMKKEK